MEDGRLIPLEDFRVLCRVCPGGSVIVTVKDPGKEQEEVIQVVTKEPGVVVQIEVLSGPREWSPNIKWPDGFVQYAKLNYYSQLQVERKDFQHGEICAMIGFLPDTSPLLVGRV